MEIEKSSAPEVEDDLDSSSNITFVPTDITALTKGLSDSAMAAQLKVRNKIVSLDSSSDLSFHPVNVSALTKGLSDSAMAEQCKVRPKKSSSGGGSKNVDDSDVALPDMDYEAFQMVAPDKSLNVSDFRRHEVVPNRPTENGNKNKEGSSEEDKSPEAESSHKPVSSVSSNVSSRKSNSGFVIPSIKRLPRTPERSTRKSGSESSDVFHSTPIDAHSNSKKDVPDVTPIAILDRPEHLTVRRRPEGLPKEDAEFDSFARPIPVASQKLRSSSAKAGRGSEVKGNSRLDTPRPKPSTDPPVAQKTFNRQESVKSYSIPSIVGGQQSAANKSNGSVFEGKSSVDSVSDANSSRDSVSDAKLPRGSVSDAKSSQDSVSQVKLTRGSVTEAQPSHGLVSDAKSSRDTASQAKLHRGSVSKAKSSLGSVSVSEGKSFRGSVSEGKSFRGSVSEGKSFRGSVSEGKSFRGSISEAKSTHSSATEMKSSLSETTSTSSSRPWDFKRNMTSINPAAQAKDFPEVSNVNEVNNLSEEAKSNANDLSVNGLSEENGDIGKEQVSKELPNSQTGPDVNGNLENDFTSSDSVSQVLKNVVSNVSEKLLESRIESENGSSSEELFDKSEELKTQPPGSNLIDLTQSDDDDDEQLESQIPPSQPQLRTTFTAKKSEQNSQDSPIELTSDAESIDVTREKETTNRNKRPDLEKIRKSTKMSSDFEESSNETEHIPPATGSGQKKLLSISKRNQRSSLPISISVPDSSSEEDLQKEKSRNFSRQSRNVQQSSDLSYSSEEDDEVTEKSRAVSGQSHGRESSTNKTSNLRAARLSSVAKESVTSHYEGSHSKLSTKDLGKSSKLVDVTEIRASISKGRKDSSATTTVSLSESASKNSSALGKSSGFDSKYGSYQTLYHTLKQPPAAMKVQPSSPISKTAARKSIRIRNQTEQKSPEKNITRPRSPEKPSASKSLTVRPLRGRKSIAKNKAPEEVSKPRRVSPRKNKRSIAEDTLAAQGSHSDSLEIGRSQPVSQTSKTSTKLKTNSLQRLQAHIDRETKSPIALPPPDLPFVRSKFKRRRVQGGSTVSGSSTFNPSEIYGFLSTCSHDQGSTSTLRRSPRKLPRPENEENMEVVSVDLVKDGSRSQSDAASQEQPPAIPIPEVVGLEGEEWEEFDEQELESQEPEEESEDLEEHDEESLELEEDLEEQEVESSEREQEMESLEGEQEEEEQESEEEEELSYDEIMRRFKEEIDNSSIPDRLVRDASKMEFCSKEDLRRYYLIQSGHAMTEKETNFLHKKALDFCVDFTNDLCAKAKLPGGVFTYQELRKALLEKELISDHNYEPYNQVSSFFTRQQMNEIRGHLIPPKDTDAWDTFLQWQKKE